MSHNLPISEALWKKKAKAMKLTQTSVYDIECANPASKLSEEQYIALRVLWSIKDQKNFLKEADSEGWLKNADLEHLPYEESDDWKGYLSSIEQGAKRPDIGVFSLARQWQKQVTGSEGTADDSMKVFTPVSKRLRKRENENKPSTADQWRKREMEKTPSKQSKTVREQLLPDSADDIDTQDDPSTPELCPISNLQIEEGTSWIADASSPMAANIAKQYTTTDDEQIVNLTLILFLNAITYVDPAMPDWTIRRKTFSCGGQFAAQTDGYLCKREEVKAIIEVKPYIRSTKPKTVRMQESAQMAAWNYEDDVKKLSKAPPEGFNSKGFKSRLLVSQDHQEIYLTMGVYDAKYVKYLEYSKDDPGYAGKHEPSFLVMNEYGPFDTNDHEHIKFLGRAIWALTKKLNC